MGDSDTDGNFSSADELWSVRLGALERSYVPFVR